MRGTPATDPLAPPAAPLAGDPVVHGRESDKGRGCETTGEPPILGALGLDAAFGLFGLTAPGIGDWRGRLAVPVPVGAVWPVLPGLVALGLTRPGEGFAGATPGEADPGDEEGAVAVPVGLPLEAPDEAPDDPAPDDPAPDDPPPEPPPEPWAWADTLTITANPAARISLCAMSFSSFETDSQPGPTCRPSASSDKFRYEG